MGQKKALWWALKVVSLAIPDSTAGGVFVSRRPVQVLISHTWMHTEQSATRLTRRNSAPFLSPAFVRSTKYARCHPFIKHIPFSQVEYFRGPGNQTGTVVPA